MRVGKKQIIGDFTADMDIKRHDVTIEALDSYTKLLIHGDAFADATGKTVTVNGTPKVDFWNIKNNSPSINFGWNTSTLAINQMGTSIGAYVAFAYPGFEACGQSFQLGSNGYVTRASFRLRYTGAPFYGSVRAAILADNGSGAPTPYNAEVLLEQSLNYLDASSLTASFVIYDFDFPGTTLLTAGTTYYFCLFWSGITSGTNYGHMDALGSVYGSGKYWQRGNLTWTPANPDGTDAAFRIYTSTTPTNYLSLADSADWNFGSGDFTIDTFYRFRTLTQTAIYEQRVDDNNYILFYYDVGAGLRVTGKSAGTTFLDSGWLTFNPVVGTWYHIALVRFGNIIKVFANGGQAGPDVAFSGSIPDFAGSVYIGANYPYTYADGSISEYRISKGIARWTSAFTPPTRTYGGARTNYIIDCANSTDWVYELETYFVNNYNGAVGYGAYPWNDSGLDYNGERMNGTSTTATATNGWWNELVLGYASALNYLSYSRNIIWGTDSLRHFISRQVRDVTGTTIGSHSHHSSHWSNYIYYFPVLSIKATQPGGIGVGSAIHLRGRKLKI